MTAFPTATRLRRAALVGALCAGLTVTTAGCGEDPDEGTNGVGKLAAEQIERKVRAAMSGAQSVRLSGTVITGGRSYRLDMRLGADGGTGQVTSDESTFELLRVGEQLYLKADATFWEHKDAEGEGQGSAAEESGEPDEDAVTAANKLQDKYVRVPAGDPSYKQLHGFTDKNVLLDGLVGFHGRVEKGAYNKVAGIRTIQLTADQGNGGRLDVSLAGQPYPLRMERAGGAGVVELADWNLPFPLVAPDKADVVDYGRELPGGE
ncbi:hypothetical protein [Streptomyces sp. NPDC006879]|uniref:hypothetical protein n=1 Tax=Streptomyces sp. NPDC006879 TaxID=3364767 RepID=UPI00369F51CF